MRSGYAAAALVLITSACGAEGVRAIAKAEPDPGDQDQDIGMDPDQLRDEDDQPQGLPDRSASRVTPGVFQCWFGQKTLEMHQSAIEQERANCATSTVTKEGVVRSCDCMRWGSLHLLYEHGVDNCQGAEKSVMQAEKTRAQDGLSLLGCDQNYRCQALLRLAQERFKENFYIADDCFKHHNATGACLCPPNRAIWCDFEPLIRDCADPVRWLASHWVSSNTAQALGNYLDHFQCARTC